VRDKGLAMDDIDAADLNRVTGGLLGARFVVGSSAASARKGFLKANEWGVHDRDLRKGFAVGQMRADGVRGLPSLATVKDVMSAATGQ